MKLSFLYAYRNRDTQRVKNSLISLEYQGFASKSYEVVFVDYGSDFQQAEEVKKVVESFDFATYHYIAHPALLWNKSKALNYAATRSKGQYIFVADVDICFDSSVINVLNKLTFPNSFTRFKLCYLKEKLSHEVTRRGGFSDEHVKHHGIVNGLILVSKENFYKVEGYDEFYHFYGAEDVDFYQRLKNSGLKEITNTETLFYHQWHPIYNNINDSILEKNPRFFNIKKINHEHFNFQTKEKAKHPLVHQTMNSKVWRKEDELNSENVTASFNISNDHAKVWHCIKVVLPLQREEVVKIQITQDAYFASVKHQLKKKLKKSDRVPISMKEVNDMILEEIVLKYRNHNYAYSITDDLKQITFIIKC